MMYQKPIKNSNYTNVKRVSRLINNSSELKAYASILLMIILSLSAESITIEQFVELEPNIQNGYMIGVIDTEIIQNAPGSGIKECAMNWLKQKSHTAIKGSYEKNISNMNTALFVILEVKKECKKSYEFTKSLIDN